MEKKEKKKESENNKLDHPIDKFRIFGALDYTAAQIAIILDATPMERSLIEERLSNPQDEIAIAYNEGKFKGKAKTDIALVNLSWKGEALAVETYTELVKIRKVNELKKELFGV